MEIRKGTKGVAEALAQQLNALRDISVSTNFHAQVTPSGPPGADLAIAVAALAITVPNATTLATSRVLVNEVKRVLNASYADMSAHKSVQTAAIATADVDLTAGTLAQVQTLANACKASYEAHRVAANVHFTNDATNTIAAPDATDQASANTLLNELKTDVTAHIAAGLAGQHVVLINP